MKKLLILCGAILLLQSTVNASENKNELFNKKDYSIKETPDCKTERYTNEFDERVVHVTFLQQNEIVKSHLITFSKDGSRIETYSRKDGSLLEYYYANPHSTQDRIL